MRHLTHPLIAAAALAASFTMMAPGPAEAQTVVRVCAINQSALVMRSRFVYADWQGTRHTSRWVTSLLAERNCATLQDLQSLAIEMEFHNGIRWERPGHCFGGSAPMEPGMSGSVVVTGNAFNFRCHREQ
ncbi:hypothetical protein KTR66_18845 [Roseococcus sp. SDR]|uniref:hypothetical protein n=1 Tax=Roseococcus sp. SDR TaxID=2835532 RepID=UPI001BD17258|nr:hypothetical protein [Roseococcus sp. SDR]MBS7792065.1 hypothetical protein [Roseococcus sp. SDR]MBV1847379.1 hypothetical protein [Roseococcus sp. SDR]